MQDRLPPQPSALVSKNPLQWCRYFGPGAVIASVTIGSGELVFPSRGGAIFGYRLIWVFLLVGFLKWVLAYSSLRHMVISGEHPAERWMSMPGPRGWLHIALLGLLLVPMLDISDLARRLIVYFTNRDHPPDLDPVRVRESGLSSSTVFRRQRRSRSRRNTVGRIGGGGLVV